MRTPRYQLALRRSWSLRRFVPPLGGTSQGATVGTPCRSCPKRGGNWPIAAHEVKRRPDVFVRALDGAGGIATRAGFLREEPLGVSFVQPFLQEQKRAGRRRHIRWRQLESKNNQNTLTNSNLSFSLNYTKSQSVPQDTVSIRKTRYHKRYRAKQTYFAYSTALVSRMRLTLIWPGYSSSFSIFRAMSRARMIMLSSVTSSGLTMIRTSRPAWMA